MSNFIVTKAGNVLTFNDLFSTMLTPISGQKIIITVDQMRNPITVN